MPVLSGNISLNSDFHKRILRLEEGSTNSTTKNRTIQETMKKYERNKKRRKRYEWKKEVKEVNKIAVVPFLIPPLD